MIRIIFDFIVKINPNLEIGHQSFSHNIDTIALYLSNLKPLIMEVFMQFNCKILRIPML